MTERPWVSTAYAGKTLPMSNPALRRGASPQTAPLAAIAHSRFRHYPVLTPSDRMSTAGRS